MRQVCVASELLTRSTSSQSQSRIVSLIAIALTAFAIFRKRVEVDA